jgi:hypothetical protein
MLKDQPNALENRSSTPRLTELVTAPVYRWHMFRGISFPLKVCIERMDTGKDGIGLRNVSVLDFL